MDTGTLWSAQIQGIWTLYASRLLRFDARYDAWYRPLLDLDGARKILEIGCGPGALAGALCRMYPEAAVTGIDRDRDFVSFAKAHVPRVDFLTGDATALPFPDDSFDATVSHTVSEHVETDAFFGEQYRVLRDGGICVVLSSRRGFSVPAPCLAMTETEKWFWDRLEPLPDPAAEYIARYPLDAQELPLAMEKYGFRDVRSGYVTIALTPDDPGTPADMAHAIIDEERYCMCEAVEAAKRKYPLVVTEEETAAVLSAIAEKFDRRVRQYDSGKRIWDTAVSVIQIVRGVKRWYDNTEKAQ